MNKLYQINKPEGIVKSKKYKESEKFISGCQAIAGIPITEIANNNGMCRQYIYKQKREVETYAEKLDKSSRQEEIIVLDKAFKNRLILSLTLDCGASLEGIQRVFENALNKNISIGNISGVIKEASERAQKFDDGINLEGITQGANDEIFQGGTPVLTGIDPESSYIYLLEEAKDRKAETWQIYMEDCKDRGLDLKTTINDGGPGLLSGIPKVYEDVEIQRDVFHALYELGKEVSKIERKALSLIKQEYDLKDRIANKNSYQKTKDKLEVIIPKTEEAIKTYDMIYILYSWFKELLSFSGYGMEDTVNLIEYVLQEIGIEAVNSPALIKEIEKVRKCLPALLSFINRLEKGMSRYSGELDIPLDALRIMYRQLSFSPECQQHQNLEYDLVLMLMGKYDSTRVVFEKLLKETKKASSLVENLNGRIRSFIEVKRIIPTKFFVLMKVYFNTRRYKRSRCSERVGRSPLELLTGKAQPDFLEALGY